jgi:competence protein ComGF
MARKGQINKNGYIFYYSGSKEKTGQAGTGFLLMKIQKHIISYELHNEHLCNLRVKGKYNNTPLINSYAPTEDNKRS